MTSSGRQQTLLTASRFSRHVPSAPFEIKIHKHRSFISHLSAESSLEHSFQEVEEFFPRGSLNWLQQMASVGVPYTTSSLAPWRLQFCSFHKTVLPTNKPWRQWRRRTKLNSCNKKELTKVQLQIFPSQASRWEQRQRITQQNMFKICTFISVSRISCSFLKQETAFTNTWN